MSWRGESKVAQVKTTLEHDHKGEKTERCHLGGDVGSREIFFLALFYGLLFNIPACRSELPLITLPHASWSRIP